jgi:hypothetical protein
VAVHAGAQFLLGKMYAGGFGVEKNADEVLGWWAKAVRKGNKHAQYHLGQLYENVGDVTTAAQLTEKAASQGHREAQFSLGLMYKEGRGVAQSDELAVTWWRKAADQGESNAQSHLGYLHETSLEVSRAELP